MVRFLSALLQVDGMDVLCVREATQFAADHCRAGKVRVCFLFCFFIYTFLISNLCCTLLFIYVKVHGDPQPLILKGSRGGEFPVGSLKGSNLSEHRC